MPESGSTPAPAHTHASTRQPSPRTDDIGRAIRDLMSLLALSALWLGKDGRTVLQLMTQAVEHLVPLRFSYVEASILPGETSVLARAKGRDLDPAALAGWQAAAKNWTRLPSLSAHSREPESTPLGPMRIIRLELGLGPVGGVVWFGSDAPGFPSDVDLALLRAAASLAATGLQSAWMRHKQEETDRTKDEFLAMLGHELRNPLAPIRAIASLWQQGSIGPDQVQRTGAILERQVDHMTHLVDDLLDVARLSTGAIELETRLLDLRGVVQIAVEQSRSYIDSKRHTLVLAIPDSAFPVKGDEKRLVQILSNLLHNAAKYTPSGGRIELALGANASTVSVAVTDNGVGIAPDMLTKVFELFTQVRRSADRSDGGLGVGLALARRLVDLHGGALRASSGGLGLGTRVEMTLPMARPARDAQADLARAAAPAPVRLKVLVVDDNEDAGHTMGLLLEALGHEVKVVHHPFAALERAPLFRPDAYLLDIGLPDIDGYELARRLRRLEGLGSFALIALTGFGQASDQQNAHAAGFDFHCTKPVEIAVLNGILDSIAARLPSRSSPWTT
jgi:signal transduction histidine kinase/ActR/RegA family two-component response regulator